MGKITLLDEHLANQIAAGEVVERPASIVKELVENAMDAKASRIQVDIEEGGLSLIRVSDNGLGMDKEDAQLAFCRHATSKIQKERDLFAIRTLGFRGEALPSIASISHVKMVTSFNPELLGVLVELQAGEIKKIEDTSRPRGTDVEIRNIFYNTPARYKYLRSESTEISHIAEVVGRLSLSNPSVAFKLTSSQRTIFSTSGDGKSLHVVHALYGKQVSSHLISFKAKNFDFDIEGFITKPQVTRSNRTYVSIILNGRYVRSVPIYNSVLRAYGTLLPNGRYPIGVIQIGVDPKLVDCNVHPAKLEVRLSKEKELCQLIETTIKNTLGQHNLIPTVLSTTKSVKPFEVQPTLMWDTSNSSNQNRLNDEGKIPIEEISIRSDDHIKEESTIYKVEKSPDRSRNELISESLETNPTFETNTFEANPTFKEKDKNIPFMRPLCQVHGTYIVAEAGDGLYLLDQHAAHERIFYEKFYKKMDAPNHYQQTLLVPVTIECTTSEMSQLRTYVEYLQKWGLELELFGENTFLVRSYPAWFPNEDVDKLIFDLFQWLKEFGKIELAKLKDSTAKMMACKAAIKANRHLRQDEMEYLIHELRECEVPFTCPHGRPIYVHFSNYELEKMFKRVM